MDKTMYHDLETERLLLKSISSEDSEFILSQFSDDDVNQYLYDAEPINDIKEAEEIINFYTGDEFYGQYRWILVRRCDGKKIGTCGYHCWDRTQKKIDVGYDMKKEFWGNGYMYEAMKAILDFADKNLDLHRYDAHIYNENTKSIAFAKKLGFEFNGETKIYRFHGKEYLHHIYTREV